MKWPISRQEIISEISQRINRGVEKSWELLEKPTRSALQLTVSEYQTVAQAIAEGKPIDYEAAKTSCEPLVDVITQGTHLDILSAVRNHHDYTYVHSVRVATLLSLFGFGMGIRGNDLMTLATGGLLHDLGKLVTPEEILNKPGTLTETEWPVMQDHVVETMPLLEAIEDLPRGVDIIAGQHHEKLDGSGYPNGLSGAQLNELARMSAICDIFGALTDRRSYKPAFSTDKAFTILASMDGQIDQSLLAMFQQIFEES